MQDNIKITLLTKEEFCGKDSRNPFKQDYQLEALKKHSSVYCTDLVILMRGSSSFWTKTSDVDRSVIVIDPFSYDPIRTVNSDSKDFSIKPVLKLSDKIDKVFPNIKVKDSSHAYRYVELGEYPQEIYHRFLNQSLENLQQSHKIAETGKIYHINNQVYNEYEFKDGTKAIYYKVDLGDSRFIPYKRTYEHLNDEYVWIKVSPVEWLIDDKTNTLISEYSLLSGVAFNKDGYDGNFENTEMHDFLNNVMFRDIFQDYLPKKEKESKDTILKWIKELLAKAEEIKDEVDKVNIAKDLMDLAKFYTDELIKIRGNELNKYGSERNLISLGIMPYYVYIESEINREISQDNKDKETLEINSIIDNLIEKASLIEDEDIRLDILSEIEELKTNYLEELNIGKTNYERIDFSKPLEKHIDDNGKEYMKYIQKLTLKPPRPVLIKELLAKEMAISKRIDKELASNSIRGELSEIKKYTDEIIKR